MWGSQIALASKDINMCDQEEGHPIKKEHPSTNQPPFWAKCIETLLVLGRLEECLPAFEISL